MTPNKQTTDIFRDTVAQAELKDCPPGVSVLDWITDQGERKGDRIRTVSKAVRAKIASYEASQAAREAKAFSKTATAAVRALPPTPATPATPRSLHAQYRAIMQNSPAAAGKFWAKNADQIKAEISPSNLKPTN